MRAVLCGYYGMGNGGDEALLATLLQLLPEAVTPVVLSGNSAETATRYGVEACPRKSLAAVLSALRQSDLFIWGGGSLMQDATSAVNPFYYGGLMALAQLMGLKTIAWAQGIGPLNRRVSQQVAQFVLQRCDGVSVRDRASAALLNQWQIPGWLAPDPVWALDSQPVKGLWDLPAPRVAVALRQHPWLTAQRLNQIAQALRDFQQATQTCILLVPFQPAKDLAIAQMIQSYLQGPNQILALENPRQLKGLFRGVEMVIAMRFHAVVMAAAAGCRCFALSYDPKVTQIAQDLDLPAWDLDPAVRSDLDPLPAQTYLISKTWIEHYANGAALSEDQQHSLSDRALLHQALLHKVVSLL
ncbi:MAG: polysaccharide pyruvyl transferase CsaB [Leptolyngbyaceae cyanobacterium SM1_1_3]|nr:polysaccharide pyruvyl transferase CsaB [Leptolyngbyaceae cyanobacterium SM1_1_3]NJM85231.1 polysaccharide pyruvyl transferase CsaB [Leptolyngbyaceae cyanobacterium RM2_2_21]NJN04518.1 polysaccharide pyruvyl transferase CsaB [Leptolyngbyaceae cyanobacterium RM1_1_2]NJO08392.1 polysaccharide pyruvyl transferase CsaB [Leptolyngbyaceae cyanobacterium SL_1_1]